VTDASCRRKSLGQSLAEFTLAIPLFFLVFLGVAEGGYFVVATTIVSHATHEGARYAILDSTSALSDVRARVQARARPIVGTTSLPDSAITIRITGSVNCSPCTQGEYANRQAGDRLRVRTQYAHRPLVGYVFPGLTFNVDERAELIVEGS
jgi:Flp pilus assembly protein TadG